MQGATLAQHLAQHHVVTTDLIGKMLLHLLAYAPVFGSFTATPRSLDRPMLNTRPQLEAAAEIEIKRTCFHVLS